MHIELRDYRDYLRENEPFDAMVSVGMAEHVGRENLPEYFNVVRDGLKPGGVFLNHAIAQGIVPRPDAGGDWFIDRYVFPDSDIPPLGAVAVAANLPGSRFATWRGCANTTALTLRSLGPPTGSGA